MRIHSSFTSAPPLVFQRLSTRDMQRSHELLAASYEPLGDEDVEERHNKTRRWHSRMCGGGSGARSHFHSYPRLSHQHCARLLDPIPYALVDYIVQSWLGGLVIRQRRGGEPCKSFNFLSQRLSHVCHGCERTLQHAHSTRHASTDPSTHRYRPSGDRANEFAARTVSAKTWTTRSRRTQA
ncbi:hypothetical protein IE81DRAFT_220315 [Ceraceosorus guamensis]|uniref:Uncharacterized protein n=1 Tax=Ceraceosorus guamensis TaxID=1522189 RepID=A0A316VVL2_9BASI|nr:hypothetical protein IE81DRAFT_220315 [Ceraceosorus guamensis]PWN40483.1 hypothetical protein IE81DRAFT_220315 [Ceraceosorus guamensis]